MFALFFLFSASFAKAATTTTTTTTVSGECERCKKYCQSLVEVNIALINIGDVTVTDVVDIENVLNHNEIEILVIEIEKNDIASHNSRILTDLLRNARFLNDNEVIVGVDIDVLTKKVTKFYKHKRW